MLGFTHGKICIQAHESTQAVSQYLRQGNQILVGHANGENQALLFDTVRDPGGQPAVNILHAF